MHCSIMREWFRGCKCHRNLDPMIGGSLSACANISAVPEGAYDPEIWHPFGLRPWIQSCHFFMGRMLVTSPDCPFQSISNATLSPAAMPLSVSGLALNSIFMGGQPSSTISP